MFPYSDPSQPQGQGPFSMPRIPGDLADPLAGEPTEELMPFRNDCVVIRYNRVTV
jgi:hypothetical protein